MALAILFTAISISVSKADGMKSPSGTTKKAATAKVVYTCPMHADVISNQPGKCPKPGCGMALVKKADKVKKMSGKMKM